jgi:hypothetical protein
MEVAADRLSIRWYLGVRRLTGRWISPTGRRGSEECWTCEQQKGGHRKDSKTLGSTANSEAKANGDRSMPKKAGGARRRLRHRPARPARYGKDQTVRIVVSSDAIPHLPITTPREGGTVGIWRCSRSRQNLPAGGRGEEISLKRTDGMPKSC